MATNRVENRLGLTPGGVTGEWAGLTAQPITPLTPEPVTQDAPKRRYKPRSRACRCGCGRMVTPTTSAPHKRYYEDACRQRAHRRRLAKARKVKPADPILAVMTCAYCGATFFAEAGKDAKFCSPSHRTAAYRQRREAAIDALVGDLGNMNEQEAADLIEREGMTTISHYLWQQGYTYDEQARRWVIALRMVKG